MPPVTRRAWKAFQRSRGLGSYSSKSACGENDLQLCITNYFKMSRPRAKYSPRNTFTEEHEIAFAQHLVSMHRKGEISPNNIGSHVVPGIMEFLNTTFGTSFPRNTIRSKYYALQSLTRLYINFKRRGTGMGWDSSKYTFMMDDGRWADLLQVNSDFTRFWNRSCYVFHLLEEVFINQGATGDYSGAHEDSPLNTDEELEMENSARGAKPTDFVNVGSSGEDANMPSTRKGKEKGKGKGKGKVKKENKKRKSGDMSEDSFFSGSSREFQQYIRVLDSIETKLSGKKGDSLTGSVCSPSKTAHRPVDADSELKAALAQLLALNLDIDVHLGVADILKDASERAIWNTCTNDLARLAFVRRRGFLPPE